MNGSSNFTGNETTANLNSSNAKAVTIKAKWQGVCASGVASETVTLSKNGVKNFDYTGAGKCAILTNAGYYKLEVWGAQGGVRSSSYIVSGLGGYSVGTINLTNGGEALYVYVGGQGSVNSTQTFKNGGFNGGGGTYSEDSTFYPATGGGATHIALTSGLLSSLSSSANRQKILIVAGGGGGHGLVDWSGYGPAMGGSGGGIQGGYGTRITGVIDYYNQQNSPGGIYIADRPTGGSQTTGFAFGQGWNANSGVYTRSSGLGCAGGGGGGYYGGYGTNWTNCNDPGGGGGSGYLKVSGTPRLESGTYGMWCYSGSGSGKYSIACITSNDPNTPTTGTTSYNATATSKTAKAGNGYARITYLGTSI